MKKSTWIINHYASEMYFEKGERHYWIAKYLKQAGYNPVVFGCNSKHNSNNESFFNFDGLYIEKIAEEINVPFIFVKGRTYTGNGIKRIFNMLDFYFNVIKAAKDYAKKNGKPDVIYASSVHPLACVAGIKLAKYFNVKCICEIRDLWPESIITYNIASKYNSIVILLRWLEKWIYIHADSLIFTMEGAYEYIKDRHWENKVLKDKVYYINNGIDVDQLKESIKNNTIQDKDLENKDVFKVIYVGSIRKANNINQIIDAAKLVKSSNIKFLIYGSGDEVDGLKKRIENEKIDSVIYKGKVDKNLVPYIVSKCNLGIYHVDNTSLTKYGLSLNKMFDYLGAKIPSVTDCKTEFNPIVNFGAGTTINYPNAENMAKEIDKYVSMSKEDYNKYISNAEVALKEYDFKNLTSKLINILEGI